VNADLRTGSKPDLTAPKFDFCSNPESGLDSDIRPCRFRANFGSSDAHSMTSSARIMIVGGTVKFEAFRLEIDDKLEQSRPNGLSKATSGFPPETDILSVSGMSQTLPFSETTVRRRDYPLGR
jgi:hypothetical protein